MAILGPFSVTFPVDFRSGGDTTKAAFGKHIQEIESIYGIINALNADKISGNDFTNKLAQHVNSTAPHPNLALSSLSGNLDMSRINGNLALDRTTGNLPFSRVTGNIDGSRITGNLTGAKINKDNVTGLGDYIRSLIPDTGSGITSSTVSANGYAKFSNNLMIQWGTYTSIGPDTGGTATSAEETISFPASFPSQCFSVVWGINGDPLKSSSDSQGTGTYYSFVCYLRDVQNSSFKMSFSYKQIRIYYIAIGA